MLLNIPTQILEAIAMCAGFLNTYLAARANIWNWLFGMITVTLFFIIFLDAKLYADMGSQVIFFCLLVSSICYTTTPIQTLSILMLAQLL
jgi:nicotinamide mononucleotide transporter